MNEELDENKCPKYKLALLCGPPGLGKTTLAHLLARQAGKLFKIVTVWNLKFQPILLLLSGYNVIEMNASDDRNLTSFKTQLEAATQMSSVMTNDSRPNCLVIDEIDGAPVVSIFYIEYHNSIIVYNLHIYFFLLLESVLKCIIWNVKQLILSNNCFITLVIKQLFCHTKPIDLKYI